MNREKAIEKMAEEIKVSSKSLAEELYDAGYRPIPELKVLSDKKLARVWDDTESIVNMDDWRLKVRRNIAIAQRDYDDQQNKGEV